MNTHIISDKSALRKEILQQRKALMPDLVAQYSDLILHWVQGLEAFDKAKCILLYLDYKNEVQTEKIIEVALNRHKKVLVPVVDPQTQTLQLIDYKGPDTPMTISRFGIREPLVTASNQVSYDNVDLILAPGVAFDLKGHRMGYGGGYYDKMLSAHGARQQVKVYALAFNMQIVEHVPYEDHDMLIDGIITEKGILHF